MKKGILLAAVACVAMFALPAVASAGVWHVQNAPLTFSGSGGPGELTNASGSNVKCSSVTVHGEYETTTTGWVKFTFHGCTGPFGVACTSSGQSSGTITTTKLTFHNVLAAGNVPALLLTGGPTANPENPKDHFATFVCFGLTTVVSGNGLIGTLNKKCGEKSASATVSFASSAAGVPNPTQITGTGTQYTLESSTSGGAPVMASEDASGTISFAEGVEQTVECTGV